MTARATVLRAALAFAWAGVAVPADVVRQPYPYIVTSADRAYYFKMSPDPSEPGNRNKGLGYAFQANAGRDDALLWSTSGWYSYEVFLASDGRHLVSLDSFPSGQDPQPWHQAVAFFESGRLVKAHSTAELIRDQSRISRTLGGHYVWLADSPPGFATNAVAGQGELLFRLLTSDGIEYLFDARTGDIASSRQL